MCVCVYRIEHIDKRKSKITTTSLEINIKICVC